VAASEVVIVASPTYKATYTGLLKVFLDRFPHQGLGGVTAIPLMLGASDAHALAVEHTLRPLLVELGATVPTRGLFVLDSQHTDAAPYDAWFAGAQELLPPSITPSPQAPAQAQVVSA
jgi:FMN reductase